MPGLALCGVAEGAVLSEGAGVEGVVGLSDGVVLSEDAEPEGLALFESVVPEGVVLSEGVGVEGVVLWEPEDAGQAGVLSEGVGVGVVLSEGVGVEGVVGLSDGVVLSEGVDSSEVMGPVGQEQGQAGLLKGAAWAVPVGESRAMETAAAATEILPRVRADFTSDSYARGGSAMDAYTLRSDGPGGGLVSRSSLRGVIR
ncbi:hypothetical protein [uncultured Propionibacterium sp.]|uniref:hypothetical protein n=1 Tax=uncultured Propionibacterium sp. TaxID=218066 RepID=UPI00292CE8A4|nr:hypothetical protein [uncultured Propionibacterium sp.]